MLNRGFMYATKGDYPRAIEDYDQAIRLSPGVAVAFYNRGVAYARTQDFDRAIQDYDQATRIVDREHFTGMERISSNSQDVLGCQAPA